MCTTNRHETTATQEKNLRECNTVLYIYTKSLEILLRCFLFHGYCLISILGVVLRGRYLQVTVEQLITAVTTQQTQEEETQLMEE